MPTTRRRVSRLQRPPFPPEALAAFRKMVELEERSEYWPPDGDVARAWWGQHHVLHQALRCKPWQFPCVEYPDVEGPHPDPEAQARYRALAAASGI